MWPGGGFGQRTDVGEVPGAGRRVSAPPFAASEGQAMSSIETPDADGPACWGKAWTYDRRRWVPHDLTPTSTARDRHRVRGRRVIVREIAPPQDRAHRRQATSGTLTGLTDEIATLRTAAEAIADRVRKHEDPVPPGRRLSFVPAPPPAGVPATRCRPCPFAGQADRRDRERAVDLRANGEPEFVLATDAGRSRRKWGE
jgi:hypothetical protein